MKNVSELKNKISGILSKHNFKNRIAFFPRSYITGFKDNNIILDINGTEIALDINKSTYGFLLAVLDSIENI